MSPVCKSSAASPWGNVVKQASRCGLLGLCWFIKQAGLVLMFTPLICNGLTAEFWLLALNQEERQRGVLLLRHAGRLA